MRVEGKSEKISKKVWEIFGSSKKVATFASAFEKTLFEQVTDELESESAPMSKSCKKAASKIGPQGLVGNGCQNKCNFF